MYIRSLIDGTVVQRMLGPGEYVRQDTPIAEISSITPLNVEAYPPVRLLGAIKVGDSGSVQPNAPIDSSYPASVTVVDEVFDPGSGTFGIRLTLPNTDRALPGGLRCKVTIAIEERQP
jgi:multidrug resistance efflux pump